MGKTQKTILKKTTPPATKSPEQLIEEVEKNINVEISNYLKKKEHSFSERETALKRLPFYFGVNSRKATEVLLNIIETLPEKDYNLFTKKLHENESLYRQLFNYAVGNDYDRLTTALHKIAIEPKIKELNNQTKLPIIYLGKHKERGYVYWNGEIEKDYHFTGGKKPFSKKINYQEYNTQNVTAIDGNTYLSSTEEIAQKTKTPSKTVNLETLKPMDVLFAQGDDPRIKLLGTPWGNKYLITGSDLDWIANSEMNQQIRNYASAAGILLGGWEIAVAKASIPLILGTTQVILGTVETALLNDEKFQARKKQGLATPAELEIEKYTNIAYTILLGRSAVRGALKLTNVDLSKLTTTQVEKLKIAVSNLAQVIKKHAPDFDAKTAKLTSSIKTQLNKLQTSLSQEQKIPKQIIPFDGGDRIASDLIKNTKGNHVINQIRRHYIEEVKSVYVENLYTDKYYQKHLYCNYLIFLYQNYMRKLGISEALIQNISFVVHRGDYPEINKFFYSLFGEKVITDLQKAKDIDFNLEEVTSYVKKYITDKTDIVLNEKSFMNLIQKITAVHPEYKNTKEWFMASRMNLDSGPRLKHISDVDDYYHKVLSYKNSTGKKIETLIFRMHGERDGFKPDPGVRLKFDKNVESTLLNAAKQVEPNGSVVYFSCQVGYEYPMFQRIAKESGIRQYVSKQMLKPESVSPFIFRRSHTTPLDEFNETDVVYACIEPNGTIRDNLSVTQVAKETGVPFHALVPPILAAGVLYKNEQNQTASPKQKSASIKH